MSELVLPEDGELLKEAVAADSFTPLELMTVLSNLKDSTRNVYLRMEQSEQTEDGIPLYRSHYRICMIWRIERYSWNRAF